MLLYHSFLRQTIATFLITLFFLSSIKPIFAQDNPIYQRIVQSEQTYEPILKETTARKQLIAGYDSVCTNKDFGKSHKSQVDKMLYFPIKSFKLALKGIEGGELLVDILSKVAILMSLGMNTYGAGDITAIILSIFSIIYSTADLSISAIHTTYSLSHFIYKKFKNLNDNLSYYFFLNGHCHESLSEFKKELNHYRQECELGTEDLIYSNRSCKLKTIDRSSTNIFDLKKRAEEIRNFKKELNTISIDPMRFSMLLSPDTLFWPGTARLNHDQRCRLLKDLRLKDDNISFMFDLTDNSFRYRDRNSCENDIKNRAIIFANQEKRKLLKLFGVKDKTADQASETKQKEEITKEKTTKFKSAINDLKIIIAEIKNSDNSSDSNVVNVLKTFQDTVDYAEEFINDKEKFLNSVAYATEKDLSFIKNGLNQESINLMCDAYEEYASCRFEYIDLINTLNDQEARYFGFNKIDQDFFKRK